MSPAEVQATLIAFAAMFPPPETEDLPPPEPLPREPMRPGEFIGHRIWEVRHVDGKMGLKSFVMECPWQPDTPMRDTTYAGGCIEERNMIGIWGFKDRENLLLYLKRWLYLNQPIIIGTAWLWGTVIEHELGYRAQYAAIRSLEEIHYYGDSPEFDLKPLRDLYVKKRV